MPGLPATLPLHWVRPNSNPWITSCLFFGIFEYKWGTQKHIDDLKKIPMVHTSTKGN